MGAYYGETPWTPKIVSELWRLAGLGMSSREIAKDLGMTKNQVVGKASREGVSLKQRPIADVPIESRPRGPAPPSTPDRLRCKWIEGEKFRDAARRGEDVFCNERVAEIDGVSSSWCPKHHLRAFQPMSKKRVAWIPRP